MDKPCGPTILEQRKTGNITRAVQYVQLMDLTTVDYICNMLVTLCEHLNHWNLSRK